MFVSIPTDPWSSPIRYTNTLGPASPYPRDDASVDRTQTGAHRRLSAIAGIVLAAVAFGAGFVGGMSAADPRVVPAPAAERQMQGEFRMSPGSLTPPGVMVPLD